MKERSLVIFTLGTQTAVGMLVWLAVLAAFGDIKATSYRTILAGALGLSMSALLVSFLHLGSPLKSIHALRNLRKSWLSREVALAGGFTLCLGIVFFGMRLSTPAWQASLTWLAALLGVSLVYAMANVYRLRTAPGWSSPFTGPSFFLTGLLLGGLAVGIVTNTPQAQLVANTFLGIGLLFCLFLQMAIILLGYFYPAWRDRGIQPKKPTIPALRLAGLLLSGLALAYWSILAGAGLILLAELLGRIEFYNSRSRVGL